MRSLGSGQWLLRLDGEPAQRLEDGGDVHRRTRLLAEDGVELGLVAPSSPLGIESLPPDEAAALIEAYEEGLAGLPRAWRAWGALPLNEGDPAAVDRMLDRGLVGLCIPATAVATPAALYRVGPLLERLERRGAPLFVHPGPAAPEDAAGRPGWWPALTSYVAGMSSAWYSFVERGRAQHPALRVLFAVLAGGAPLHIERLTARGGPLRRGIDTGFFYDTSSYGWRALEAMASWVGFEQLVYGSDRPVVTRMRRPLGYGAEEMMRVKNPSRLLGLPA